MSDLALSITDNLKHIRSSIEACAKTCSRDADDIELLAVSKTKPVSDIMLAYEAGQRHFGENYVQEGVEKVQQLTMHKDLVWHFIGPLQSNKSRLVAENFDWMHSVDRLKIAKRLNEQRPVFKSPLNICIQVNIDHEPNKAGVHPDEVLALIESMSTLSRIKVRGLMAIPIASKDKQVQTKSFEAMRSLFVQCQQKFDEFDTLSIGMSSDMDSAIECGSTMVRIGTAIFGARKAKQDS